jgi:hypothetical protein
MVQQPEIVIVTFEKYILGILLVIYSIVKISFGLVATIAPPKLQEQIQKHALFKHVITDDNTFSGKFVYYCFIIYGIYSFIHGLSFMNLVSENIDSILSNHMYNYIFNFIIGIVLTVYYYFVAYTNIKLDKDDKYHDQYIVHGIITGLLFLIFVPIMVVYNHIMVFKTKINTKLLVYLLFIFMLLGLMYFILNSVYNLHNMDIVSKLMVPLNILS